MINTKDLKLLNTNIVIVILILHDSSVTNYILLAGTCQATYGRYPSASLYNQDVRLNSDPFLSTLRNTSRLMYLNFCLCTLGTWCSHYI